MKLKTLVTAMFASAALTSVAMAEDDYKIVDEPLELSIQMNHKCSN